MHGEEEARRARQVGDATGEAAAKRSQEASYPSYRVEPGRPFSLSDVDPNESEH